MATFEQFAMDHEIPIVTRSTSGLGCELALVLAAGNANVVMVNINAQVSQPTWGYQPGQGVRHHQRTSD
jgi:hypothetical protein